MYFHKFLHLACTWPPSGASSGASASVSVSACVIVLNYVRERECDNVVTWVK